MWMLGIKLSPFASALNCWAIFPAQLSTLKCQTFLYLFSVSVTVSVCVCMYVHMCVHTYVCHGRYMKVRGQPEESFPALYQVGSGIEFRSSSLGASALTQWPSWPRVLISKPSNLCQERDYRPINCLIPPFVLVVQGWENNRNGKKKKSSHSIPSNIIWGQITKKRQV